MKFDRSSLLLYAVTDRKWTSPQVSLYDQVCAAIDGGVSCVQLREKQLDAADFLAEARLIGKLCRARRVPFIINDNVELALRCQADGVHIGQDDMDAQQVRKRIGEQMILGVSAHNVQEARTAFQNGADYLGAGAVFSTSTKNNVTTLPLDTLREICSAVELPVVAIGGHRPQQHPQAQGHRRCRCRRSIRHLLTVRPLPGCQRACRTFPTDHPIAKPAADWGHHLLPLYKK